MLLFQIKYFKARKIFHETHFNHLWDTFYGPNKIVTTVSFVWFLYDKKKPCWKRTTLKYTKEKKQPLQTYFFFIFKSYATLTSKKISLKM